jgi:hypothetical protein
MINYKKIQQFLVDNGMSPGLDRALAFLSRVDATSPVFIQDWNTNLLPRPSDDIWEGYPEYLPVPPLVSKMQLRLALFDELGLTPPQVAQIIETAFVDDEPQKVRALIAWEDASEYHRTHPLVIQIGAVLGFDTPEKVDEVFRKAAAYS